MGTTEMTKVLTATECTLLQRYYDGDPLADAEVLQVEELLNGSPIARVFMGVLEELTTATQAAEEAAWEHASPPAVDQVVQHALTAASMAEASLDELAPLLERFFDGEVVAEEMATVQALINERDDVADYLANLDGLRASVRVGNDQLVDGVSFDGFWDSIESRIEDDLDTSGNTFDPDEHRVLLYRYHDDEVTTAERAQVDAWLASGTADVVATLAALSEVRFAMTTAVETAQERVDFGEFWHRVEDAIDDGIEAQGENVVSLAREKRDRKGSLLGDSRFAAWTAVAAMLFVAFGAGLFKDQLFGPGKRVVVEKTVVIVDSVEYQPGSSVMVNTPMRPVSSVSSADNGTEAEEEPTVIWLLDGADDAVPADDANKADDGAKDVDEPEQETSDQPI